jgi:elongation factor G
MASGAPTATNTSQVRNVALVGPPGSGKSAVFRGLLVAAGALDRPEDFTAQSTAVGRSERSTGMEVATVQWRDHVITLVDTPGFPDFVGELRAGLRAVDAAIFVVSAVDGVDALTAQLWQECEAISMPRAIVVSNTDRDRADFDEAVAICQRVFPSGSGILPIHFPVHDDDGHVVGLIDTVLLNIHDHSTPEVDIRPCEPEHIALLESHRNTLIETLITESEDAALLDSFLDGAPLDEGTLLADLERSVARGHFHPVLVHSAGPNGIGLPQILDLIVKAFPSPLEHPLPPVTTIDGDPVAPLAADPAGPLCAEIVRTSSDPYVGKTSIVRVFSGTLHPDATVHVSGHFVDRPDHTDHDLDEHIGALQAPLGALLRPVHSAIAGSIVAVLRLTRAETGDTLSDPDYPLLMAPWQTPLPLLPLVISPHAVTDDAKLGEALARLAAEDPTVRIDHDQVSNQIVLWCMGEAHGEAIITRLRDRFGVSVDTAPMKVWLRESFTGPASGSGRVKKQTSGHGQFAVCEIDVTPGAPGSGVVFADTITGGTIPKNFITAVEAGVREQAARGVFAGFPLTDVVVTLTDGKTHAVDSSDQVFRTAGAMALRDAATRVDPMLLEPIATVAVTIPDEHVGAITADLTGRRGQITGSESLPGGNSIVTATVPEAALTRYAIELRSLAHGAGAFTREPAGFAPLPKSKMREYLNTENT